MSEVPLIETLVGDRKLAHQTFFDHRHHDETPRFHYEISDFLHSNSRYGVILAFRGAAKSTIAEEDIVLDACQRLFHNCVIVGSSETRAIERLQAIAHELENNEPLLAVFGRQRSARQWTQTKIVLRNGVVIQAIGRDQAVRGLKHLDWRPDYVLLDDIEDRETVQTREGRDKTIRWLFSELIPVVDPRARIRCLATPMDSDSVPVRLIRDAKPRWPSLVVPIKKLDSAGQWEPVWGERYPLRPTPGKISVDELEEQYTSLGLRHVFNQEFMCDTSPGERGGVFARLPIVPRIRSFEPVYAMVDPARSTARQSAGTGVAVWSYFGGRVHVWKAFRGMWLPDELIERIFEIDREFNPVFLGIEDTGLAEWLRQPLRDAMLRHHRGTNIKPIPAPRNSEDFIRAMQAYASNGEITLNEPIPDLEEELANFPARGAKRDIANALAYFQTMKPGLPVYERFTNDHIDPDLGPVSTRPVYLAANATKSCVAGALCQYVDGQIRIYADWVAEGDPGNLVAAIHCNAAIEGDTARWIEGIPRGDLADLLKNPAKKLELQRQPVRWVIPREHGNEWNNVGLLQAIRRIPAKATLGTEGSEGRRLIADLLSRNTRGGPGILVGPQATWTLRALGGGYHRSLDKRTAGIASDPEAGPYRTLMEGIEAWAGLLAHFRPEEEDDTQSSNYAYDARGRRYLSAMPQR